MRTNEDPFVEPKILHRHPNRPLSPAVCPRVVVPHSTPIVIQHLDGTAYLLLVFAHPKLEADTYVTCIREEYYRALRKIRRSFWCSLFTKSVIGTANICQVIEQDPNAILQYPAVFVNDFQSCDFLSYSWKNSQYHRDLRSMIVSDHLFASTSKLQDLLGSRAIIIRQALSKIKMAILLMILLFLGSIAGCVVGLCTRRADVAVAVTAGIFAFVAVLQGLVVWLAT